MGEGDEQPCLFCQDKIFPYSSCGDASLSGQGQDNAKDQQAGLGSPNLPDLCKLMGLLVTEDKLEQLKSYAGDDKTCDSFLCLGCFELADKLRKLNVELEKIRDEICATISKIAIINQKVNAARGGKGKRSGDSSAGKDVDCFQLFQRLVKDSCIRSSISTTCNPVGWEDNATAETSKRSRKAKVGPVRKRRISPKKKKPSAGFGDFCGSIPNTEAVTKESRSRSEAQIKIEVQREDEGLGPGVEEATDYPFDDFRHDDEDFVVTKKEPLDQVAPPENQDEQERIMSKDTEIKSEEEPRRRSKRVATAVGSMNDAKELRTSVPKKKRKSTSKTSREESTVPPSNKQFTCRQCNVSFDRAPDYARHFKENHSTNSFKIPKIIEMKNGKRVELFLCTICDHRVRRRQLGRFKDHMLSHEIPNSSSEDLVHPCNQCEAKFSLKINLDLHKMCLHDWHHIHLKCDFCQNTDCKTQQDFISHLKTHLSEDATIYACKSCPMACTTLDKLLKHMIKHSNSKRLICPECPEEFATPKEIYRHCQNVHKAPMQTFECSHCPKSFLIKSSLLGHLRQTHGIGDDSFGNIFTCSKCKNGKVYNSKLTLDRHMNNMHPDASKGYQCPHCDKCFSFPSQLQVHVENKHASTRFPCPHCPKSYKERTRLTHHLKTHTGQGLHTCDRCGKQFPTAQELKFHSVTHLETSELTRCVCEICGKEFNSEHRLLQHKRNHKEKKLECQHCHRKYNRLDNFRAHMRTHTGERPYICPVCEKDFNRKDILIVHMKVHGFSKEEAFKAYDSHVNGKIVNIDSKVE